MSDTLVTNDERNEMIKNGDEIGIQYHCPADPYLPQHHYMTAYQPAQSSSISYPRICKECGCYWHEHENDPCYQGGQ